MAVSIKTDFPGIGSKTVGSQGTSTEWNGIVDAIESINSPSVPPYAIELGNGTVTALPTNQTEPNILIGKNISDADQSGSQSWASGGAMAIGNDAEVSGWRCMAIGHKSLSVGVSNVALGYGTIAMGGHAVALGRGAHCAIGGTMIGSIGNQNIYFANNHGISFDDLTGVSFGDGIASNYKLTTIHGRDGKDQKEVPTYSDHAGGDIEIMAGRGTGPTKGGKVILSTHNINPDMPSGNTLNVIDTQIVLDSETVASGESNVLMHFVNNPGSQYSQYRLSVDLNGFVKATLV